MNSLSTTDIRPETYGALSLAMKHIEKSRWNKRYGRKHLAKAQKLIIKASRYEGKKFSLIRDINTAGSI